MTTNKISMCTKIILLRGHIKYYICQNTAVLKYYPS